MNHQPTLELAEWLPRASADERRRLAALSDTSLQHLRHIAAGRRGLSARKAAALEAASLEIHVSNLGLPPVLRTSSCAACAVCPQARATLRQPPSVSLPGTLCVTTS
jgi:hypothetical protein